VSAPADHARRARRGAGVRRGDRVDDGGGDPQVAGDAVVGGRRGCGIRSGLRGDACATPEPNLMRRIAIAIVYAIVCVVVLLAGAARAERFSQDATGGILLPAPALAGDQ